MANTHGMIISSSMTAQDVDAYNRAGVYSTGALDNGVCVTLSNINRDGTSKKINGFEYVVAPATDASYGVWIIDSPEVGYTLESQLYSDPRYFTNEAGKPFSIKFLQPKVDIIEVDANTFVSGTLPTTSQGYVTVGTGGKFVAASSAPVGGGVTYFTVVGFHSVAIGGTDVSTVLLQCEDN